LLLALGKWPPVRDLLLRVFKTQNPDGDWPQWFMCFERERDIRPNDSHGDIIVWPLLALTQYLVASEDAPILDEVLPFFRPEGDDKAEKATLWAHVERVLKAIAARVISGTNRATYGHGDWNDSLQPVDPAMCGKRVCAVYRIAAVGHGPTMLTLNETKLSLRREANPNRTGGAMVSMAALRQLLTDEMNTLQVQLQ
jgi:cellobiose phosphorylase